MCLWCSCLVVCWVVRNEDIGVVGLMVSCFFVCCVMILVSLMVEVMYLLLFIWMI